MDKKVLTVLSAIAGIVIAITIFAFVQVSDRVENPNGNFIPSKTNQQNQELTQVVPSTPVSFSIPRLGIQADIESVGQDKNGRMDVPKNVKNVAWYNLGYKPGEGGNAVLAGHLDDREGRPAVFYNISTLRPGDELFISDKKGKEYKFIVTRQAVYDDAKFPLEEVFGSSGISQLILITCTGFYDSAARNYSQRIVVYSKLQG